MGQMMFKQMMLVVAMGLVSVAVNAAPSRDLIRLANSGNSLAQNNLGTEYDKEQNYELAVEWFRKAAEKGQVNAQYNLGVKLEAGQGVAKDMQQATYWYKKAAAQGHTSAQYVLKQLSERQAQQPVSPITQESSASAGVIPSKITASSRPTGSSSFDLRDYPSRKSGVKPPREGARFYFPEPKEFERLKALVKMALVNDFERWNTEDSESYALYPPDVLYPNSISDYRIEQSIKEPSELDVFIKYKYTRPRTNDGEIYNGWAEVRFKSGNLHCILSNFDAGACYSPYPGLKAELNALSAGRPNLGLVDIPKNCFSEELRPYGSSRTVVVRPNLDGPADTETVYETGYSKSTIYQCKPIKVKIKCIERISEMYDELEFDLQKGMGTNINSAIVEKLNKRIKNKTCLRVQ